MSSGWTIRQKDYDDPDTSDIPVYRTWVQAQLHAWFLRVVFQWRVRVVRPVTKPEGEV